MSLRKTICYWKKCPKWLYNLFECEEDEVTVKICLDNPALCQAGPYCKDVKEETFHPWNPAPACSCALCKPFDYGYNICKFPVWNIQKIIGWSHGYENLVMKWKKPYFTWNYWKNMADEMAKYVNAIRFFAYCTEDEWFVKNSFVPFWITVQKKYDLRTLSPVYIDEIKRRLNEYFKRDITVIVDLFTSIKGKRFVHSPWHNSKNINNTTDDHKKFLTHQSTKNMAKVFIRNFVREFDTREIIYRMINEPLGFKGGQLERWYDEMIEVFHQEGVPNERIMINFVGNLGSKIYKYLEKGLWGVVHGWNTLEVVRKAHNTTERWGLREDKETGRKNFMIGSGDGGAEFGTARGLKIYGGGVKNRKASSLQMRQMIKFDMSNGKIPKKWQLTSGHGIEFMSNSAFAFPYHHGYYYPNLNDALRVGTKGLTELDCLELGVDFSENKYPELKAIYNGYKWRSINAD